MLVQARPGDAVFAACLRLFRNYPLAVRRHYAEHRYGSMVLMNRETGVPRFFVLIMEWDDLFVLRHWDRLHGARAEIEAGTAVPADVRRVIEASVPVPRDGALRGWLSGCQVQAVVAAYGRLPEPLYADQLTLRAGTAAQTATQLLALPGVVDLAIGGRKAA